MKTIIHEGVPATMHVTIEGDEHRLDLDFQVLPLVGDRIRVGRTCGYISSTHIVETIEHQVLITDSGNLVYIHIYTTPEDK